MKNEDTKPICKSVFKNDGSHENLSKSVTSKWIELIDYIEKNNAERLKNKLQNYSTQQHQEMKQQKWS